MFSDCSVSLINTNQGDAGYRYFRINMTDGIRLDTGGKNAVIKADNVATADKTFQFPNLTGTFLMATGTQDILTTGYTTTTGLGITGITGSTQCLQINTNGVVSGTGSACGAGGAGVDDVNGITGSVLLVGTANRITISSSSQTITFTTPQDLATASTPTFAGMALGAGNLTMTGAFAESGSRSSKGWFSALDVDNTIDVGTIVISSALDIPSSATLQVGTEGYIGIDLTSDTIQFQGSATRTIAYWREKCLPMASSTWQGMGTSTEVWSPYKAITVFETVCSNAGTATDQGTTTVYFGDYTNNMDTMTCGYTQSKDSSLSNNTWTADESFVWTIESITGTPNFSKPCIRYYYTAD